MSGSDPENVFRITIGNTIAEMQKVVDLVEAFGAHHSLPQRFINDLNICLDELLNNTISYGYDDDGKHCITVEIVLGGGVLSAEIRDDAKPFDPCGGAPEPAANSSQSPRIGGLGLHFVKSLMDEITYTRSEPNNIVRIMKRVTP